MSDTASLEERIAYLEEQNAGMKKVGLLLIVFTLILGFLLVFSVREVHGSVDTGSIILNEGGTPRSALTVLKASDRQGHVGMLFFDELGLLPTDVEFAKMPDLDGVVLYDKNGKPRIALGVDAQDQAVILALDPAGQVVFRATPSTGQLQKASGTSQQTAPTATSSPQPAGTPNASPTP